MQFVLLFSLLFIVAQSPSVETFHQTLQIDNAPYDAIITRPKTPGKHPAVFLIDGLGCYSLDNLKPDDPFFQLLSGLTQRGYVTMRVDKNGEGKSGGPPCDSLGNGSCLLFMADPMTLQPQANDSLCSSPRPLR